MLPRLSRYVNQTILVCIPSLFSDGRVRPCRLAAIELYGLWLESDELFTRMLPEYVDPSMRVGGLCFVPFAQIAGVAPVVSADLPDGATTDSNSPEEAAQPQTPRRRR